MRISSVPGHGVGGVRNECQGRENRPAHKQARAATIEAIAQPHKGFEYGGGTLIGNQAERNRALQGGDPLKQALALITGLFDGLIALLKQLLPDQVPEKASPAAPSSPSPPSARVNPSHPDPAESVSEKPVAEQADEADPEAGDSVVKKTGMGHEPGNIWSGFRQGPDGNCVTVSAIKAAMVKFGQLPSDIFKEVTRTGDRYDVEMRDGFKLHFSKDEFNQAARAAQFRGDDQGMVEEANFLFAASAKRAQMENNDGYASRSFAHALHSLNDGEDGREGLERLGLRHRIRETTAWELAQGQLGVVSHAVPINGAWAGHSLAVIGGREEVWGRQGPRPPANSNALALD